MSTVERRNKILASLIYHRKPSVVEWLTENISIPRSMSPGRIKGTGSQFSIRGQNFARHILESANPSSGITDVTVCGATQVFKTFGMLMISCYRMVNGPLPQLIVFPTKDTAQKAVSKLKLQPLIRINPVLAERMPINGDDFTDMQMMMRGGPIRLTGTNSAANLASTSEGIILQDEVCKFEHHKSEDSPESHPMLLADERSTDFGPEAYRYKSSSPNHVLHPFWMSYEAGSQTHFLVACPNCQHRFPFEDYPDSIHDDTHIGYEQVSADYKALRWNQDAKDKSGRWDEIKVRESIRYHCPSCDYPITEQERIEMLDDVEPFALNPTATKHLSFRLPKFYTTSQTMGAIAWNRIKPGDLLDNTQNHANSWLANPFQDIKSNIKEDDVRKVRDASDYRRREIKRRPLGIYIGADVGDSKQHWVVGAVYANDEIDIIDWGTVVGLEDLLTLPQQLKYRISNTDEWLTPQSGLVDSKDRTLEVFAMTRKSNGFWYPSKGSDAAFGTWGVTAGDYQRPDLYTFNSHQFKRQLYIQHIKQRAAPMFLIPRDTDEDFIHGLSGQQVVVINKREQFKRVPGDHYGDACIRIILAKLIMRAKRGEAIPDMPAESPSSVG